MTTIESVRKHGSITVATRRDALALVSKASDLGYTFRQVQVFGGFLVTDEDD